MVESDSPEVLRRFHETLDLVDALARRVLRRQRRRFLDLEELKSAGFEGLLLAARAFDPAVGVAFATFAQYRVRGAMLDAIRRAAPLSRRDYALLRGAEVALEVGAGNHGWRETPSDAVDAEAALDARLAALATAASLAIAAESARPEARADFDLEEIYASEEFLGRIRDELSTLSDDEAAIVRLHYFEGKTLTEVSADLDIGRQWVSRLHARAIARLAVKLGGPGS